MPCFGPAEQWESRHQRLLVAFSVVGRPFGPVLLGKHIRSESELYVVVNRCRLLQLAH